MPLKKESGWSREARAKKKKRAQTFPTRVKKKEKEKRKTRNICCLKCTQFPLSTTVWFIPVALYPQCEVCSLLSPTPSRGGSITALTRTSKVNFDGETEPRSLRAGPLYSELLIAVSFPDIPHMKESLPPSFLL